MVQKQEFHEVNAQDIKKVLLMGYNGANNTGSEARLLAIIEDVRKVLGPDAIITIPTLCRDNLRRYIKEGPNLKIADIPPLYFFVLYRLARENDLILLTEGSCYMDTWSSYLLWAWLWVTWCGTKNGKLVAAYAVDSGSLSGFNRRLVKQVASRTNLIITRTQAAACRLKTWEVSAPIEATADSAFNFNPESADIDLLKRVWPSAAGAVGIAPVDFYLWPVVFRLFGRRKNCYRWPFYYSDSRQRRLARELMAESYARFGDRMIEKYGRPLAFICMEQLDESFARLIQSMMLHGREARVFSSREYNASQMTAILRGLNLLVTSRYHAGVLSLNAAVPQIAIGHDQRLHDLYRNLEIYDQYFLEPSSTKLFRILEERAEYLMKNPAPQQEMLRKNYQIQHKRSKRNPELLTGLLNREVIK